jgi:hypothetical protein
MNKLKLSFVLLLAGVSFFFFNIDNIRSFLKSNLPDTVKIKVKEIFFGKEYLEKIEYYSKLNYNQKVFPITQFEELTVTKIKLRDLDTLSQSHFDKINNTYSYKYKFFLDQLANDVYVVSVVGKVFVFKNLNFNSIQVINSNLQDFKNIEVLDTKIINNFIYVSFEFSKLKTECKYFAVHRAKINEEKLIFENFFSPQRCNKNNYGGRIAYGKVYEKNGVLLSTGAAEGEEFEAQNDNSHMGKIIFFSEEDKNPQIISKGHRNPQGLYAEGELILSTEHGPYGGDEINKIIPNKNYGWPVSSYGETYEFKIGKSEFNYSKNHKKKIFEEPVFSFVPSVGISEIIKIPNNFSRYWQDNFFVASLNGSSLFRIKFDENFEKVIFSERINLLDRIRDIIYISKINSFALAMEDHGEIWLLKTAN